MPKPRFWSTSACGVEHKRGSEVISPGPFPRDLGKRFATNTESAPINSETSILFHFGLQGGTKSRFRDNSQRAFFCELGKRVAASIRATPFLPKPPISFQRKLSNGTKSGFRGNFASPLFRSRIGGVRRRFYSATASAALRSSIGRLPTVLRSTSNTPMTNTTPMHRQIMAFCVKPAMTKHTNAMAATVIA